MVEVGALVPVVPLVVAGMGRAYANSSSAFRTNHDRHHIGDHSNHNPRKGKNIRNPLEKPEPEIKTIIDER